jgi:hypothetical protein
MKCPVRPIHTSNIRCNFFFGGIEYWDAALIHCILKMRD